MEQVFLTINTRESGRVICYLMNTQTDHPSRFFVSSVSLLLLLLFVLASGSGCQVTKGVADLSQRHLKFVAHQVRQIDDAFETADGQLFLRTTGRLAGESKQTRLMVVLPPVRETARTAAQRVVVPNNAVRPDWRPEREAAGPLTPVSIGPPLVLTDPITYDWDQLRRAVRHGKEVRLVRRLGAVERWEVLYLNEDADTGERRFVVFEIESKPMTVSHPSALTLAPLAVVADVVIAGMTVVGGTGVVASGTIAH